MPGSVHITDEHGRSLATTDGAGNPAGSAILKKGGSTTLIAGATGVTEVVGSAVQTGGIYCTFQATSDASHAGTTTVEIQVSNDGVGYITMGTISITGASDSDGFASNQSWQYTRAEITSHGDDTNEVTVTMGG